MIDRRRATLALASLAAASSATRLLAADKIKPDAGSVLVVVDVQNCFLPGGSLAVKDGDKIVPTINRLAKAFQNVVLTQDWHTPRHISFASSHPGKKPFDVIRLPYGDQVLWPDHCVQGTEGAALAKDLDIPHAQLIIRKGFNNDVDSYSAFLEADKKTHDRPRQLSEGARHLEDFRRRAGDRFLRRLVGDRRPQGRPRGHRHRGRDAAASTPRARSAKAWEACRAPASSASSPPTSRFEAEGVTA